jgi:hypothetical protein
LLFAFAEKRTWTDFVRFPWIGKRRVHWLNER